MAAAAEEEEERGHGEASGGGAASAAGGDAGTERLEQEPQLDEVEHSIAILVESVEATAHVKGMCMRFGRCVCVCMCMCMEW